MNAKRSTGFPLCFWGSLWHPSYFGGDSINKAPKGQKRSVTFDRHILENLDKAALKKGIPTAQLIREYVDKGLSVEGYSADISFIRTQIREELTALLMPQINRLIKIIIKSGLMSVGSFYLLCDVLAEFVHPAKRIPLEQSIEAAKKKAAVYLKIKDSRMDDVYNALSGD